MSLVRNWNDVLAGIVLIAVALIGFSLNRDLAIGNATGMGPGYLPRLLCFILAAFGAGIVVRGCMVRGIAEAWIPRPILWILASVAFFGLTIERFGLVVAIIGLVGLAVPAHGETRLTEAILLAIAMAVFSVLVFVNALGLPIPVWPSQLAR